MSRRYTLNFTVRKRSIWDLKMARQEKSPWVKTKKKTGLKKTNKVKNRLTKQDLQQAIKVRGTTSSMLFQNHPRRKISGQVK